MPFVFGIHVNYVLCLLQFLIVVNIWTPPTSAASSKITCKSEGTCSCRLSDSSGLFDLRPLSGNTTHPRFENVLGEGGDRFWFDPCVGFSLQSSNKTCDDVAVCRQTQHPKDAYFNCGDPQPEYIYFEHNDSVTLMYNNNKQGEANKITVVTVKCTESVEHHLHVYKQARPDRYNMTLESPYGCLQRIKPFINKRTIGPGAVIILIFLVVIFLYCGLGCVIKRAIYNAKGADQVPHYEFWTSLPGLIKDGCAFVAGCCQAKQPQHNYDQM